MGACEPGALLSGPQDRAKALHFGWREYRMRRTTDIWRTRSLGRPPRSSKANHTASVMLIIHGAADNDARSGTVTLASMAGFGVPLARGSRHQMHDPISVLMQIAQESRHHGGRSGLGIMQQNDASSCGFQPLGQVP